VSEARRKVPLERRRPIVAADALFEWETRHQSRARRWATSVWLRCRRGATVLLAAGLVFVGGAAVAHDADREAMHLTLEERLQRAESTLKAREGELALAHLELNRLEDIVAHSQAHRIPADLARSIYDIARLEGVDPSLAFSLVRVESGFTRRAVSSAGAVGLTQVMPSTAFWLQPGLSYNELFERDTNLRLGFRYLRMMLEQYEGDLHLALLAYNRGPGRVDEILNGGGDPSNGYSDNVRFGALRIRGD
jgi:soluble lytic murein transglycosylase-like protein